MRSSDWSSDVCSSDLPATAPAIRDRSHAMSNDTETAARALVEATRSGKLGDAYRVLDKRPVDEVQAIALQAGFSCISRPNRTRFMVHIVRQVADAARNKTAGYGQNGRTWRKEKGG